jgi:plasmid stabilization system protein ParE
MERFQVLVAAPAEAEIEAAYLRIRQDSLANAAKWRAGLLDAAATLETFPERCRLAPENGPFKFEIRQFLYGNYRLLFTVREDAVVILHVRHGARDWMKPEDVVPPVEP